MNIKKVGMATLKDHPRVKTGDAIAPVDQVIMALCSWWDKSEIQRDLNERKRKRWRGQEIA